MYWIFWEQCKEYEYFKDPYNKQMLLLGQVYLLGAEE